MSSTVTGTPKAGWHSYATVVPPYIERNVDGLLAMAILDASGAVVSGSECTLNKRSNSGYQPDLQTMQDDIAKVPGRWVFGGFFQPHFGHKITQCLGRLPWLDLAGSFDGIVFAGNPRAARQHRRNPSLNALLSTLGVATRATVISRPKRFEELFVGPTLFGEVTRCVPDPMFKSWLETATGPMKQAIVPGRRIYVSRSRLHSSLGHILCEDILEQNLQRAGFEIYYPEEHSMPDQIATYMQAEVIVASDGTAAHMIAFAQQPGQMHIFISRRRSKPELIINHLRGLQPKGAETAMHFVNCIAHEWHAPKHLKLRPRAEIDFDKLYQSLRLLGVLTNINKSDWTVPETSQVNAAKALGAGAKSTSDKLWKAA